MDNEELREFCLEPDDDLEDAHITADEIFADIIEIDQAILGHVAHGVWVMLSRYLAAEGWTQDILVNELIYHHHDQIHAFDTINTIPV
jgi:hypothetical protein